MKKISIIIITAISILNIGCEDLFKVEEVYETFTIKAGQHRSVERAGFLESNRLTFKAYFDATAVYEITDPLMWNAKNKLLGFADCNVHHQTASARFAWQWMEGRLEIYAYTYVEGQRQEAFVGTVALNSTNTYSIELTNDSYIFYLNDKEPIIMSRSSKCDIGIYYLLWPYFGGQIPAPHDINITIAFIYNN